HAPSRALRIIVVGADQKQESLGNRKQIANASTTTHLEFGHFKVAGAGEQLLCADTYDVGMLVFGRLPEAEIQHAILRRETFDIHGMIGFSETFAISGELAEFAIRL